MSSTVDPVVGGPERAAPAVPGWQRVVGFLAPLLLGAVFLFSAWTKIAGPKAFVATLGGYDLFPTQYTLLVATLAVALEVALGVLLLTGIYRRVAAWLSLPLLVFFLGLVIHASRAGLKSCGCFGEVLKIPPAVEIGVDVALLMILGLVLWRGRSVRWGPTGLRQGLAWGALFLGAGLFLAGNPTPSTSETLDVTLADLAVLQRAQPPVTLPRDGFLFLFSADCDHCWAYTPAVEAMHRRLQGFSVIGVTLSDPQALAEYQKAFGVSFPIHVLSPSEFDEIAPEYPAGIWLRGGRIEKTWSGFIPSHRELAELGGYEMLEGPLGAPPKADLPPEPTSARAKELFGAPIRARHD